ncbi:MAG: PaaI family thioesterase [Candidatus Limnocylindria bacterium]
MSTERSLQERYAPRSTCFGCGPSNQAGLRIRSFPEGDAVVLRWRAASYHEAFAGHLSGGIAGTLLDCHMNWTATHHLMRRDGLDSPPCTVTAGYSVSFERPIPTAGDIEIVARVVEDGPDRATVEAMLSAGGKECARGRGTFVAVSEGHPAFHRW